MEERSFPAVSGSSVKDGALGRKTSSRDSISQTTPAVKGKLSISRTAEENEQILSRMRSILQNGGSAADLKQFVSDLEKKEGVDKTKTPSVRTDRRTDAAADIVRKAHAAEMSVEEYLRENAELYETEDGWNSDARRALRMESGARYSISPAFASEIENWDENGRQEGELFILGETGEVLQGLGAMEQEIYLSGDKIGKILTEHPEMTMEEIKRIPEILDDPVLVLKSRNVGRGGRQNTRIVVFGSVRAKNGQPVLSVLDLRPEEDHLVVDDMQKVSSAYTKDKSPVDFVKNSEVLHADKKRATRLLRTIGSQMPIELLRDGSVGSISYFGQNVNIEGVPFSEVFRAGNSVKSKLSVSAPEETFKKSQTKADSA